MTGPSTSQASCRQSGHTGRASRRVGPRPSRLLAAAAVSGLLCTSCTDLALAPYRHEELLRDYRYALGEKYVQVKDMRLCYQDMGHGPNVLIIPGLLTSVDFWQEIMPVLAKRFHVWAIDPPGCGKSDKPDVPYDLPWIRDRIIDFMDVMKIEKTTLIGGSLGGQLAMMIALEHPERVDRLVLMGSSGAWPKPSPPVGLALHTLWNEVLVTDHLRRNWPSIYGKMFDHESEITRRLFDQQMALRADGLAFFPEGRAATRILRSIFFNSLLDRLAQIRCPTLLIWGEHDQWHLRNEAMALRSGLADAHLVFIADSGHEVMLDKPDVFNQLVLRFLDGVGIPDSQAVTQNRSWRVHMPG